MTQTIDTEIIFPRLALALALCATLVAPAKAQNATIYRCQGGDGVVEYSNSPVAAQPGRTCKAVEISPITTIPAPKLPPRAAGAKGGAEAGAAAKPGADAAKPAGSENFPRVDASTQKARDGDRKRILEDELGKEQEKLAALRKEYNNGEPERLGNERNYQKYLDRVERLKLDIARSEANVQSIQRELGTIRD